MTYECDDCGMNFDTTNHLANHKLKFCIHSKTANQLDKRLDELKRIEYDIDYGKQKKSAAPSSVRNAGIEIMGIKKPPPSPALSDMNNKYKPK